MLVEELMILANECVGAFLASRNRPALYRVHEQPDPKAVEHLIAKLADLGVPTPPVPSPLTPQLAATVAGEASKLVATYTAQAGRGKEAFPSLVLRALKQARYDPKNLGHAGLASERLLPLHVADPPVSRPDRPPGATSGARPVGRSAAGGSRNTSPSTPRRGSAKRAQIEYAADAICLSWLLEQRLFELGWDEKWEGEIIGLIGSGLFVRFGEVFEGFLPGPAPARRVLPVERPRDRDGGPHDGPHVPPR